MDESAPTFTAAVAEHLHAFNERMNDSIGFRERIWLESKRRRKYADQKSANIGLRSTYALRLYGWAKKYVSVGTKSISLEQLRKVLGLESIKDADGNIIEEAPLPVGIRQDKNANEVIREKGKLTEATKLVCPRPMFAL